MKTISLLIRSQIKEELINLSVKEELAGYLVLIETPILENEDRSGRRSSRKDECKFIRDILFLVNIYIYIYKFSI